MDDDELCFDALDFALLKIRKNSVTEMSNPEQLGRYLSEGGSAWKVVSDNGTTRLERRVGEEFNRATEGQRKASGRAESYLRKAWRAMYGREPDYSVAYAEAVKAIEAATVQAVLPKDKQATLGRAIGHLKANPKSWSVSISPASGPSGIETFVGLIELVWRGHEDRHAPSTKANEPPVISRRQAEFAIHVAHMAAFLIQNNHLSQHANP